MKRSLSSLSPIIFIISLFSGCAQNAPSPCYEGTVLSPSCPFSSGAAGYAVQVKNTGNLKIIPWTDVDGITHPTVVSVINLPANHQVKGKKIYFNARPATNQEIVSMGPITANCLEAPRTVVLNISDISCPSGD